VHKNKQTVSRPSTQEDGLTLLVQNII